MDNVVQMSRTCSYLVSRAARHRSAGRYDEAMALLAKAKNEFGADEAVELEMARVYEGIGREDEAARSCLRVVRCGGRMKPEALFQLSLSALKRLDIRRASAYFGLLTACSSGSVPAEEISMLWRQIIAESKGNTSLSRKARVRTLQRRAAQQIQRGRCAAAQRELEHAAALHENAQGLTLLACCHLLRGNMPEAVGCAENAHRLSPRRVQTLCVLSEVRAASGDLKGARHALYLAALMAKSAEDLHAAALESAKLGEDRLTLVITGRLLRREAFHTQGMTIRACALANLGRRRDALRLFGRLCGLLPEDSVCEAYFRQLRDGNMPLERLDLGMDVTRSEGVERASEMIAMLYEDPEAIAADPVRLRRICRICAWALRSSMVGSSAATVALILMSAISAPQAREVLEDLLCDPMASRSVKLTVLQLLADKEGFRPCFADIDGSFVCLAAGGLCPSPVSVKDGSQLLQQACDRLSPHFLDAPKMLLPVYVKYMQMYPHPKGRQEAAFASALEYVYHLKKGHKVYDMETLARQTGASRRQTALFVRRILKADDYVPQKDITTVTEENR